VTCQLFEEQLSSYLDGELQAARAVRLEAHLKTCPHCQAELRAMRGISAHIRAASTELQVSQDFDQRVLRTVGYLEVTGRIRKQRSFLRPLVVAMVTLLSLLGTVRYYLQRPAPVPVPVPQSAAAVAPAAPQSAPLPLPDSRRR
jgi:anti-sigma factor RsiW